MKIKLLDTKTLQDFPSGSAIEFYDDHIYLVGDDAREILVLTKRWNEVQRISLFDSGDSRIPKDQKADLESMALIPGGELPKMLIVGSGSFENVRNKSYLLDLQTSEVQENDLSVFYARVIAAGVSQLNIEATAVVKDSIVFCNRANQTNKLNQFIITDLDFWMRQDEAEITILPLVSDEDWPEGSGVSGLAYSEKNDWLIFTASTEDTSNTFDDGAIGSSYLGVIENASRKVGRKKMKINALINLGEADPAFEGHKLESVCIQREGNGKVRLQMAADNDTGNTTLFKIRLKD